ncbi:MAG: spermidine/putrescine ABC transporter substrate-binding protein [Bryobacterales bacterium]|nr:spermidine/putrescine ABC transporter substrate-binding protein [Bryobacteraceae bacterium]MDW8353807.1 spermidine/putrescine ABC transporter substrate-binding protein [Bryobacterales bacterium]
MKRRVFLVALTGLAGCARQRSRLNVFNWSNYVARETVPDFEKEFGVGVRYGVYESNEEMLARVLTGNSGWDVAFPTHSYVAPMRDLGLLAELDHDRLPNLDHLAAPFRSPDWDPGLRWSVPYMWGASGIVYNRAVAPPPVAWADLWREDLAGRLTMLDDPFEVLGACLKKLGFSLNSTDERELRLAAREAIRQKRLLRAYLNAEVRDQLVAGDVLAAQLWATTAQQAIESSPQLAFVHPLEGFGLYMDCAVILKESRRKPLAHEFLNYLLRPQVAAAIVRATRTATANDGALALLDEPLRQNRTLYPPPEVLARGEWFRPMPAAAQRLRDRLWTEIKAA